MNRQSNLEKLIVTNNLVFFSIINNFKLKWFVRKMILVTSEEWKINAIW